MSWWWRVDLLKHAGGEEQEYPKHQNDANDERKSERPWPFRLRVTEWYAKTGTNNEQPNQVEHAKRWRDAHERDAKSKRGDYRDDG
jgi:hypothetical protein